MFEVVAKLPVVDGRGFIDLENVVDPDVLRLGKQQLRYHCAVGQEGVYGRKDSVTIKGSLWIEIAESEFRKVRLRPYLTDGHLNPEFDLRPHI